MDLWRSFGGMVRLEYTAADISAGMRAVNRAGITVYQAERVDDLTLRFSVARRDHKLLRRLIRSRGERLVSLRSLGLYWTAKRLLCRPILMAGILLLLGLTLFLPTRVLFVEVEGNASVPANLILSKATEHGVHFWSTRKDLRSEKIKNALIQSIPELQWVGINTVGCRAVISVRERTDAVLEQEEPVVSSIVADRDGVIQEMTVIQGSPLCRTGQSVKKGQVLISGYWDLGICIQATEAKGEIYAETTRSFSAGIPAQWLKKTEETRVEKKYSLIIGKNRINFDNNSGISGDSCGKMYEEYYLTLPGGFRLPIALAVETWTQYGTVEAVLDEGQAGAQLSAFAEDQLTGHMIAGRINARFESITCLDGLFYLTGKYACYEMIGRTRPEEILQNNEISRTYSQRRARGGSDLGIRLLR